MCREASNSSIPIRNRGTNSGYPIYPSECFDKSKFQKNVRKSDPKTGKSRWFLSRKIEVFCDISENLKIQPRNNPITRAAHVAKSENSQNYECLGAFLNGKEWSDGAGNSANRKISARRFSSLVHFFFSTRSRNFFMTSQSRVILEKSMIFDGFVLEFSCYRLYKCLSVENE